MDIKNLRDQFNKAGGKKTPSQKLHKKFDKKVEQARDARLVDREQGYKKMPAFKKKSKPVDDSPKKPKAKGGGRLFHLDEEKKPSSFNDKLAKTVKKDEEKKKRGGLSID